MALPIQHISTYNVLLADLFDHTEANHPDKETLRIAVVLMKQISDGIELAIKEGENKQKILTIQSSFITNGGFEVNTNNFLSLSVFNCCNLFTHHFLFFFFLYH